MDRSISEVNVPFFNLSHCAANELLIKLIYAVETILPEFQNGLTIRQLPRAMVYIIYALFGTNWHFTKSRSTWHVEAVQRPVISNLTNKKKKKSTRGNKRWELTRMYTFSNYSLQVHQEV